MNRIGQQICALLCVCALVGYESPRSDSMPEIHLGFTTQNFIPAVPVSPESARHFITYAQENGFRWIELRDPDASLTETQCREIAIFAEQNGIEIVYSAQCGLLAEDFHPVFTRALQNAAVFHGPRQARVLALRGRGERGWDASEFKRAAGVANQAAEQASAFGFQLMIENADVILDGDAVSSFPPLESNRKIFFWSQRGCLLYFSCVANVMIIQCRNVSESDIEMIRCLLDEHPILADSG